MANDDELNLAKGQETGEKKSGGIMKIVMMLMALLLVAGGGAGGAYFFLGGGQPEPAAVGAEGEPPEEPAEPEEDPIYLSLSPPFVVNFQQDGRTRYLQIELQTMSYDQGVIDKVEANLPAVRNGLILLLSDQDYDALTTVEGKEDLRKQVLESINKVIRAKASPRVNDVFFTGFVMQ